MHLGLAGYERKLQLKMFLDSHPFAHLPPRHAGRRRRRPQRCLRRPRVAARPVGVRGIERRPLTFPAWGPMRALDAIFVRGAVDFMRLSRCDSDLARRASDHRPLVAEVRLHPHQARADDELHATSRGAASVASPGGRQQACKEATERSASRRTAPHRTDRRVIVVPMMYVPVVVLVVAAAACANKDEPSPKPPPREPADPSATEQSPSASKLPAPATSIAPTDPPQGPAPLPPSSSSTQPQPFHEQAEAAARPAEAPTTIKLRASWSNVKSTDTCWYFSGPSGRDTPLGAHVEVRRDATRVGALGAGIVRRLVERQCDRCLSARDAHVRGHVDHLRAPRGPDHRAGHSREVHVRRVRAGHAVPGRCRITADVALVDEPRPRGRLP